MCISYIQSDDFVTRNLVLIEDVLALVGEKHSFQMRADVVLFAPIDI